MNEIYVAIKIKGRDCWLFGQNLSKTFDYSVTACSLRKAKVFKSVEQAYRWANRHILTGPNAIFEKVVCGPVDRLISRGVVFHAGQK